MNVKDVAAIASARRTREVAELARKARAQENFIPVDYSVAGNARITLTPAGKRSRTAAANELRKHAR